MSSTFTRKSFGHGPVLRLEYRRTVSYSTSHGTHGGVSRAALSVLFAVIVESVRKRRATNAVAITRPAATRTDRVFNLRPDDTTRPLVFPLVRSYENATTGPKINRARRDTKRPLPGDRTTNASRGRRVKLDHKKTITLIVTHLCERKNLTETVVTPINGAVGRFDSISNGLSRCNICCLFVLFSQYPCSRCLTKSSGREEQSYATMFY